MRYAANRAAIIARQRGFRAAATGLGGLVVSEIAKLARAVHLMMMRRARGDRTEDHHPTLHSEAIVRAVSELGRGLQPYHVDVQAFRAHVAASEYPPNYAAGSLDEGGGREQKLLEYFVSIDLLDIRCTDLVIDVASEWSVFPETLRRIFGATVYQQDLIYPAGLQGHQIGGSAAHMPVPNQFADKLVLHNAFEHFEGRADTDFVFEAWRVLKPGGVLCILPLALMERYTILTDPLVDRRGIVWDDDARIVELPWWNNRFGRHYDAAALERRVLEPGTALGFVPTIYHIVNVHDVHLRAYLHFALTMRKPVEP